MKEWRFDQGRLDYFQVGEIKKIALALANLDGIKKPTSTDNDIIRKELKRQTELPFLPANYTVWRNYGRVFECMLLATENSGIILATNLCKEIAKNPDEFDSDSYLAHYCRAFYYSSPIFKNYIAKEQKIYPGIAIIKFLISEYLTKSKDYITIDEIFSYIISNNVTGLEDVQHYGKLKPKTHSCDTRQVRELVKFISQLSFLKWENPKLYIEVKDIAYLHKIEQNLKPIPTNNEENRAHAILEMGKGYEYEELGNITVAETIISDDEFTEGKKIRVTHVRSERSSKLRAFYFKKISNPQICRMCDTDTTIKYPWTDHVIELHHLLPLSSPIRVESGTTSLKDLVGLCPSCHRATHKYYTKWFTENSTKDFKNHQEALSIYNKAKSLVSKKNV